MEFISSTFIVISVSVTIVVIITIIWTWLFINFFLFIYSHYGTISTERSQMISATLRMHSNGYYFTLNYLYIFASISNGLNQP